MNRRKMLELLGFAGIGAASRVYFDMGAAWQKHESGLLIPKKTLLFVEDQVIGIWNRQLTLAEINALLTTGGMGVAYEKFTRVDVNHNLTIKLPKGVQKLDGPYRLDGNERCCEVHIGGSRDLDERVEIYRALADDGLRPSPKREG